MQINKSNIKGSSMAYNTIYAVICPHCDEDIKINAHDIDDDWQEFTCNSCNKVIKVKMSPDFRILVSKIE